MRLLAGQTATILTLGGQAVSVTPVRPDTLGLYWFDTGDERQVGVLNDLGNLWELGRDEGDAAFLENVVRSVVADRVIDVSAGDRAKVEVSLADGTIEVQTQSVGLRSFLPKPGWTRLGERVQHAPYRE